MTDQLPTLDELEKMRRDGIAKAINTGLIATAENVAVNLGKSFESNRTGWHFEFVSGVLKITRYRWSDTIDPITEEPIFKNRIVIRHQEKMFARVSFMEPADPNFEYKHDFVVPGEWEKIIVDLLPSSKTKEQNEQEEMDLIRRKEIAEMLHIKY